MERRDAMSPETLAAQALGETDAASGGLVPAINLSTNYEQQPDGSYPQGRVYTRADNPTSEHAEQLLAALEGGECACALFSSGMAAATAVFQSLLPGDHVLVSRVLYWGVRKWLAEFALTWGLDVEFTDTTDLAGHAQAVLREVRVFKRATSLGGVESLIEHRRASEGPSSPVPDDLLRLSAGPACWVSCRARRGRQRLGPQAPSGGPAWPASSR